MRRNSSELRLQRIHGAIDHFGIGAELLPQGHGYGILVFGAIHLQHIDKFPALGGQGRFETLHGAEQFLEGKNNGQLDRGRVGVIGGLGAVDVVVGVQVLVLSFGMAQNFQPPIGDDLVGIHVGGGPRPALEHVHHEMVVKLSGEQFRRRPCRWRGILSLSMTPRAWLAWAAAFLTKARASIMC